MSGASDLGAAAPFGAGSISLGVHPPTELSATCQVEALLVQSRAAEQAGFDGVTISEHHAGFESYLPQPILLTGWMLDVTERIWAAPAPMLLGLRSPALAAEELAWTNARHPGRVSLAVAPGYAVTDFDAIGVPYDGRIARFRAAQETLVGVLAAAGPLGRDAAIAAWAARPARVLTATNSVKAVEIAAELGLGIIFPGSEDPDRLRGLTGHYRDRGGAGAVVWIRSVWIGQPPETEASARLSAAYRRSAASGMRQAKGFRSPVATGEPAALVEHAVTDMLHIGATALNVRLHVPGLGPEIVIEQIERFGDEVAPGIRAGLG